MRRSGYEFCTYKLVGGNLLVRCHTSPATGEGVALRLASLTRLVFDLSKRELRRSGRQQRDLRKFTNVARFSRATLVTWRRLGLSFGISAVLLLVVPGQVEAKRVLPQSAPRLTAGSTSARGVTTTVKFKPDRRGITATFKNLSIAADVTYSLTYVALGIEQGVDGAVNIALGSVSKDLIFGTCSAGVCRYDTGIVNARLTVTTMLRNGKRIIKIFRLKV